MAAVTRFGLEGYGVRRAGSFAGKTQASHGPHPVGVLSRFGLEGYGVRRAGSFANKDTGSVAPPEAASGWIYLTQGGRPSLTRKQFAAIQAAKRAQAEALQRVEDLRKSKRKRKIEEAARLAAEAIEAAEREHQGIAELRRMATALNAAVGAANLAEMIRQANIAIAAANAVMEEIEDEEETIALLLQ